MSTRDLQSILLSGDITGINLNGGTGDDAVLTLAEIRQALLDAGVVSWHGAWVPDTEYSINWMVTDEGYLAIANKATWDRPAPKASGNPDGAYPVTPTLIDQSFAGVVHSGNKYTFSKPGWLQRIAIYAPELTDDTNYRIVMLNLTNPAVPIMDVIDDPILIEGDWAFVTLGSKLVLEGDVIAIYIDALNSGSNTTVTGGWTYGGTSNTGAPPSQGWNTNNGETLLRVTKTDLDSTDRSTELLGIGIGSTVRFSLTASPDNNYKEFYINSEPIDLGTYYHWDSVQLIGQAGTLGGGSATTMLAEIPVPQATKYSEHNDYWLAQTQPDFCSVEGYLELGGTEDPGHENDAYGVEIVFQRAIVSDDWDLLALTTTDSSGGGSGSTLYDFHKVTAFTVPGDTYTEVGRLTRERGQGLYEIKMSMTYTLDSTINSAFARWTLDGGATWNEYVSEPKDVSDKTAVFYAFPYSHTGGTLEMIFQMRKENAADTLVVDYLDLIFDQKQ